MALRLYQRLAFHILFMETKPELYMTEQTEPTEQARRTPKRLLLTKKVLDDLRSVRPHRQHMIWDTKETGLSVLVSRGPKSKRQATLTFRVTFYLPNLPGKPRYKALGRYPECSDIEAMRDAARHVRMEAKEGVDPKRPRLSGNFKDTADRFIDGKNKQRTWTQTKRILETYVVPEWADRNIEDITKSDVSTLLHKIESGRIKTNGKRLGTPAVARAARAQLVSLFNWYVENYGSDQFRSPIVKSKQWKQPARRERVLTDAEIRALWQATDEMGVYGSCVRLALLTAQRFRKVSHMRRSDLKQHMTVQGRMENGQWVPEEDIGNVWDPTRANDPKNKQVSVVPLSELARDVLASVPIIDADRGGYVFTLNGRDPISGWSKFKDRLDRKMEKILQTELQPWQHRDLRRTARTLMARCGVANEIAEHCLAHALPAIQATYNRYDYLREKQSAFERLAEFIEHRIVNPPAGSVVQFQPMGVVS
jgi:integrase